MTAEFANQTHQFPILWTQLPAQMDWFLIQMVFVLTLQLMPQPVQVAILPMDKEIVSLPLFQLL